MSAPEANRVFTRTPNASAIRGLVQPDNVNRTARARSASPRSRDAARTDNAACCSSFGVTGDFPLTTHLSELVPQANRTNIRWSSDRNLPGERYGHQGSAGVRLQVAAGCPSCPREQHCRQRPWSVPRSSWAGTPSFSCSRDYSPRRIAQGIFPGRRGSILWILVRSSFCWRIRILSIWSCLAELPDPSKWFTPVGTGCLMC
jgi:hypothetical protein